MKIAEQLLSETVRHTEHVKKSEFFYAEYEKFLTRYEKLMASGLTKPRESQLQSADAQFAGNAMVKHPTLTVKKR